MRGTPHCGNRSVSAEILNENPKGFESQIRLKLVPTTAKHQGCLVPAAFGDSVFLCDLGDYANVRSLTHVEKRVG